MNWRSWSARYGLPTKAEALAAELDEQDLVRVGGGHSVTLVPDGWQLVRNGHLR